MEKREAKAGSFEERWLHRQHACGEDDLGPPTFLKCGEAVLPDEAAPLLGFEEAAKPRRLWDVFGPKDMWSAPDKQRVASYQMIGSDGSGNPICIEDGAGAVWMLDHEDHFRTRQFVNSSVSLLAESLLACMGESQPYRLLAAIEKLDRPAAAKGTFWDEAAANIGSMDDDLDDDD